MDKFILKNTYIYIYIYIYIDRYFYKNKESKLCFRERDTVQNDFIFFKKNRGSINFSLM